MLLKMMKGSIKVRKQYLSKIKEVASHA
jgi:hypothetical protein